MQPKTAPAQTSMMTCANFTKSAEEPASDEVCSGTPSLPDRAIGTPEDFRSERRAAF
jgi:hypothetical protein